MSEYNHVIETGEMTVSAKFEPSRDGAIVNLTEAQLEDRFDERLREQRYERVNFHKLSDMEQNLRGQLEKLNEVRFSDREWKFLYAEIADSNKGIEEKTELLQNGSAKISITRDDGSKFNVMLIDKENIHSNSLQFMRQYVAKDSDVWNRYDVTILVNGLPLAHVELKRPGVSLREAFNQINRYQHDSFWKDGGLFNYVQIFVISNGIDTRYYANTTRRRAVEESASVKGAKKTASASFEFASRWADERNVVVRNLDDFTRAFFARVPFLSILTRYCVFTEDRRLMVMRPYQIAATQRIVEKVNWAINAPNDRRFWTGTGGGGFVWHTTGSGKTLTSFKTAQLVSKMPGIDNVLFVVDRKDLDYQTIREYDRFQKGAANGSANARVLKSQLEDRDPVTGVEERFPIIVTTIQKLDAFIKKADKSSDVFKKRVVFIFDECHRSQFGDMNRAITKSFKNRLLFGFTGTPIFKENARTIDGVSLTTEHIFGSVASERHPSAALHVYNVIDAINDKNVLKFKVDFVGTIKSKDGASDYPVEKIDSEGAELAPERIRTIVRYIIAHFDEKTMRGVGAARDAAARTAQEERWNRERGFNSMFAVSSVKALKLYYEEFKRQLGDRFGKDFKIATVFSASSNPNSDDAVGTIDDENSDSAENLDKDSIEFLESAIRDYNAAFQSKYSAEGGASNNSFANYYKDVSRRVKAREVDLLLVVNMFLTGFDAPSLNTLWLDKNLRYHGLIQGFSRTNRILNATKSHGNIVCFRNLRKELDDALMLFGNKKASGIVLMKTYMEYMDSGFDDDKGERRPSYRLMVDAFCNQFPLEREIVGDEAKRAFVKLFSAILKRRNILLSFDEFEEGRNDVFRDADFKDYLAKYLQIHEEITKPRLRNQGESIVDDLEFELELVAQIDVSVDYILRLVAKYATEKGDRRASREEIDRAVAASPTLRSKKELVEQFVERLSPNAKDFDAVRREWLVLVGENLEKNFDEIVKAENLDWEKARTYLFEKLHSSQLGDAPEAKLDGCGRLFDALFPRSSFFVKDADGRDKSDLKRIVLEKFRRFYDKFSGLLPPRE